MKKLKRVFKWRKTYSVTYTLKHKKLEESSSWAKLFDSWLTIERLNRRFWNHHLVQNCVLYWELFSFLWKTINLLSAAFDFAWFHFLKSVFDLKWIKYEVIYVFSSFYYGKITLVYALKSRVWKSVQVLPS